MAAIEDKGGGAMLDDLLYEEEEEEEEEEGRIEVGQSKSSLPPLS